MLLAHFHFCVCIDVSFWFVHLYVQIKELISKCPEAISRPLLKARLSEKQWESVMFINHALRQEYECRRQMLLQRLDVTILSFQWSDRAKVSFLYFTFLVVYYIKAFFIGFMLSIRFFRVHAGCSTELILGVCWKHVSYQSIMTLH